MLFSCSSYVNLIFGSSQRLEEDSGEKSVPALNYEGGTNQTYSLYMYFLHYIWIQFRLYVS